MKPIFLVWYRLLQPKDIDTVAGTFEVWVEKSKCFNWYKFRARQKSVKVDGKEYFVNDAPQFNILLNDEKTKEWKKNVIELRTYACNYIGHISCIMKELDIFEEALIDYYNK